MEKRARVAGVRLTKSVHAIHRFPATGWVRANRVASEEILTEINDLRRRNAVLKAALADLGPAPAVSGLAGLDEEIQIPFTSRRDVYPFARYDWTASVTWREVFFHICPYLETRPVDLTVKDTLQKAIFQKRNISGDDPRIDDQTFRTIALQLKSLGLVKLEYLSGVLFWSLTGAGERLMLEIRTVRKAPKKRIPASAK